METLHGAETHNINDRISFKLTEHGQTILAEHFARQLEQVPDGMFRDEIRTSVADGHQFAVAEDGTVTLPLWEVASTFGPHLSMTGTQVFENNSFSFRDAQ